VEREQQTTPHERLVDLIQLLVSDWRPSATQVLWGIRIGIVLGILVLIGYFYGITLWQWVQLLIIPAVIAAGGAWFNSEQNARERFTQEQRAQDDALQAYLGYVSNLMIDHLKVSSEGQTPTNKRSGEVSAVASIISSKEELTEMTPDNPLVLINLRARTLAVLERLNPYRKVNVLGFLYESGLIFRPAKEQAPGISVFGADLRSVDMSEDDWSWIDLSGSYLNGAILAKTVLGGADLPSTDLTGADLTGADLTGADLTGADLTGADLSDVNLTSAIVTQEQLAAVESLNGATMPDGSKHD
jgi:hypothetical protein